MDSTMTLKKASFEALTDRLSSANANPMLTRAQHFLNKIILHPDEQVLDVGCRDGVVTQLFAHRFPDVYFTALSKTHDFLAIANQRLETSNASRKPNEKINNIEFHLWDLTRLPYQHKFDAIISFCFLHWTSEKQWVINNLFQTLKPGGRAYLQFFPDHRHVRFDVCAEQVASQEKWRPYFRNFESRMQTVTPGKFAMICENAGFMVKNIEIVKPEIVFPNIDLFQIWLMSVISHVDYVPQLQLQTFIDEVTEQFFLLNPQKEDGYIRHHDYLLEAILEVPE